MANGKTKKAFRNTIVFFEFWFTFKFKLMYGKLNASRNKFNHKKDNFDPFIWIVLFLMILLIIAKQF